MKSCAKCGRRLRWWQRGHYRDESASTGYWICTYPSGEPRPGWER